MNSSLERSRVRDVVFKGDLLKLLRHKIGVRYMLTEDQYSGEHLSAHLFGSTSLRERYFWTELSAAAGDSSVAVGSKVSFEIWEEGGPNQIVAKFAHWESMRTSHPWWNVLVSDRLFVGAHASGIPLKDRGALSPMAQRLSLFHGLLVGRLQEHRRSLDEIATKEPLLRPRAELFGQLVRRFGGFVAETRKRQLATADPTALI